MSAEAKATAHQLLITVMSEPSCENVTQVQRKRNGNKILKCSSEILEKSGASVAGDIAETKVDQYLKEPLIQFHHANSHLWWKHNTHRFHNFRSWLESIWLYLLLQ